MTRARRQSPNSPVVQVQKVAAYLRVSTDEQADSGLGLANQRRRCEAMAVAKGWPTPVIFQDAGVSGTKDVSERPALSQLLEAVRRKEFDGVIVLALARLGRRTRLVLDLVEELTAHGSALVSCQEQLDTSTSQGQFTLTVFAALAQLERDQIAERTTAALAELSRRSGETGGKCPYGYRRYRKGNDRCVRVDPSEKAVVRDIFAWHDQGISTREIAARLQDKGIRPPRTSTWRHSAVIYILANRAVYAGGLRGDSKERWPRLLPRTA
jgi:site-specific DNA recombinase